MSNNEFLSPHFKLSEFEVSRTAREHNIPNVAPPEAVANLRSLCEHTLEPLREVMGLPIVITSGYRCKALNEILVHAARTSQHMNGCAADFYVGQAQVSGSRFQVSGDLKLETGDSPMKLETGNSPMKLETPRQRLVRAFRLIITCEQIDYDQLIIYPTFIHVSYVSPTANRHKLTKANGNGKYCALSRADALAIV